jgi:endonuclease III
MHGQTALYLKDFFNEVLTTGVPRTVQDCVCFYGIGKKSACLFLSVVFGQDFGIPVDRHLKAAFKNMGWVHQSCDDETTMSHMVELWLPMEETGTVNNVLAGLRQIYNKTELRPTLLEVAISCGKKYKQLLDKLTKDMRSSSDNT